MTYFPGGTLLQFVFLALGGAPAGYAYGRKADRVNSYESKTRNTN